VGDAGQTYLFRINAPNIDAFTVTVGDAGDFDANGRVDAADYVTWRKGGLLHNEAVTIGSTTPEDYTYWRNRFGNISPSAAAGDSLSTHTVPEPGCAVLLMIALWTASLPCRAVESKPGKPVSNRTTLRETWAKEAAKE